jgi:hypothetical protein
MARKMARHDLKKLMMARRPKPNITKVEADLDPQISKDRIVIPAKDRASNFDDKSEIIALDNSGEPGSPPTRFIDVKSGFDGASLKNIDGKKILIGVGIGLALVLTAKKLKWI